jgi:hypothetical protein
MSEEDPEVVQVPRLEHERAVYSPRVVTSASLDWLVNGYRRALARFTATAKERDAQERFIPLFETLNRAVAIMDYSRDQGRPLLNDEIVRALRFARNRVHHQLADALEPRDVPFPQALTNRRGGSRIIAPPTVLKWFWKPLDELPDAPPQHDDPQGEKAYTPNLQGQPVQHALDHLDSLLPRADG